MPTLLIALLLAQPLAMVKPVPVSEAIVGAWSCDRGPCFDPEIEFAIEDGERIFRSWLHHRPASRGTWSVEGSTVTVTSADMKFEYRIVRVNRKELVLRQDDDESARYLRIKE